MEFVSDSNSDTEVLQSDFGSDDGNSEPLDTVVSFRRINFSQQRKKRRVESQRIRRKKVSTKGTRCYSYSGSLSDKKKKSVASQKRYAVREPKDNALKDGQLVDSQEDCANNLLAPGICMFTRLRW